jgi:2-C-methyl-D-erythritol 4-phosphate cytidylyltransferase
VWAVVVAAGSGTRLGAGGPKAFVEAAGRRLVDWALDGAVRNADRVVVVVPAGAPTSDAGGVLEGADVVVAGADSRSGSVRCGIGAIPDAGDDDVVVIHDAARPLASDALYAGVVAAVVAGADGAVPGVPVADTLKRVDGDGAVLVTVERDGLVAVQTPQAFRLGVLRRAHAAAPEASDDAGLVEAAGGRVVVVPGDARNRKVTTPDDLAVVAALLAAAAPLAEPAAGERPLGAGS